MSHSPSTASHLATALLVLACAGCAGTSAAYRAYEGPERPVAEIATLQMRDATSAVIGGQRIDASGHGSIQLLPGSYTVTWDCLFGASVMVAPSGFVRDSVTADVLLQAGHTYSFRCERSHGYGYRTYLWIADDTVNMLAAGHRKP